MAENSNNDEVHFLTPQVPDEGPDGRPVESDPVATPPNPPGAAMDEASRLEELQADVRNQDDLERDITRQADRLLVEQADERDNRRLERTRHEKEYVAFRIRTNGF